MWKYSKINKFSKCGMAHSKQQVVAKYSSAGILSKKY